MTYREAMRVLLEGTCGVNAATVARGSGLSRFTVRDFLDGSRTTSPETIDAIGWFIFRRMNAPVLLGPEDYPPTAITSSEVTT